MRLCKEIDSSLQEAIDAHLLPLLTLVLNALCENASGVLRRWHKAQHQSELATKERLELFSTGTLLLKHVCLNFI